MGGDWPSDPADAAAEVDGRAPPGGQTEGAHLGVKPCCLVLARTEEILKVPAKVFLAGIREYCPQWVCGS